MEITNKTINYKYYKRGKFGNKLRTWYSLDEWINSDYSGLVTIRSKIPGGECRYNVSRKDKPSGDSSSYIVNESAPDERLAIQGEITIDHRGYTLFYSTEKGKMRDCLQNGIHISGLKVKMILKSYMTPSSYNDLIELLEMYPNHIVEFSTYSMLLGDCAGRNTIIWEVRKY